MKRTKDARKRSIRRRAIAPALAAVSATFALAASSAGAVTIGQITGTPGSTCFSAIDRVQVSTAADASYIVPSTGGVTDWTVTSWSHTAGAGDGQQLAMKFFRKVADPNTYQVVGHDGPRPLTPSTVNTFPVNLRVRSGDVLGSNAESATPNECRFTSADPADFYLFRNGNMADGESQPFTTTGQFRLNISAVVIPTNTFTLGSVTRNKKKGTAKVTATGFANPGQVNASGRGIKLAVTSGSASVAVSPSGTASFRIKAKGKKQRKLNRTGKAKVELSLSYTPTGGSPRTESLKIKLKKKLKR